MGTNVCPASEEAKFGLERAKNIFSFEMASWYKNYFLFKLSKQNKYKIKTKKKYSSVKSQDFRKFNPQKP